VSERFGVSSSLADDWSAALGGGQPFGPTRESTLSVQFVRGLASVAERAGVPQAQLLSAEHFDVRKLDVPEARVQRFEFYRICRRAMDLTRDRALGLHWGEHHCGTSFPPLSQLVAYASCLRQALETLSRFERLLSDEPFVQLLEGADQVTVRCLCLRGEAQPVQMFWAEMNIANLVRLMRPYGVHARLDRLCFAHPAPAHRGEYARIFGPAVRFDQPFTELVFDRALMATHSPHNDEDIYNALRALAERRMMKLMEQAPYALRARELLVQHGWASRPDMEAIARGLGLSVRSLRRHLATEGKSYHAVEREALATVATHLLRDERRTIREIASEMGFSDKGTFQRAFKRWTGTTPSAYRKGQFERETFGA
jgi:AraC-like DNA-binding protein